jgi:hypothetical protein
MQLDNNIVFQELIVCLAQNQASCSMPGTMHYSYKYRSFPFEFSDDILENLRSCNANIKFKLCDRYILKAILRW